MARTDPHGVVVNIRLLGVPLDVRRRVMEHTEEVLREVQLLAAHDTDPTGREVIMRLARLRRDWPAGYRQLSVEVRRRLDGATEAGLPIVDVTYFADREIVDVMVSMEALFDELEELCRTGSLLTLAAAPECVAYRHWILGQYIDQLAGRAPVAWPEWAEHHGLRAEVSGPTISGPRS
jgi:hypothetical protein